jgi:type II secretory pathway pseudopilin PulG
MFPVFKATLRGFCAPAPNVRLFPFNKALSRGFSLVEVVLALGVIAFALVGIMGLFPVALKSAQESQRETRATLIAQQIFSDLRTLTGTNRLLVRGPSTANASALITNFSLAGNTNIVLSYDIDGKGRTDQISTDSFAGSFPDAAFLANVDVDTNTGIPNLSRVQATIEAPAAAPSTNRSKYTFVTLMGY